MPAILSENLDMGAFFMREKLKKLYIVILVFILSIMGQYGSNIQSQDAFSPQIGRKALQQSVKQEKGERVYASGVPIGIYVKTEGILVLGVQQVEQKNGKVSSPSSCKIKAGDYILKLNNSAISTKQQFIQMLQKNGDKEIILTIKRKNKKMKVKICPVYSVKNNCYLS